MLYPPPAPTEPDTPAAASQPAPPPATTKPGPLPAPDEINVVFQLAAPAGIADSDIGAQQVAVDDGEPHWSDEHVLTVSASTYLERHPSAVTDGHGGFVAVFEAEVPQGPLKGDVDLLAQRVTSQGALLWGGGSQSVPVATTSVVELAPQLLPDGDGGVWLVFERHGRGPQGEIDSDLAAQHVDGQGQLTWANGSQAGLPISTGQGLSSSANIALDGAGGMLLVFEREPLSGPTAGSTHIAAQRLDQTGRMLWGAESEPLLVAASRGALTEPTVLPQPGGGALVIFVEEIARGEDAGDSDIASQRIEADGSLAWSASPDAYKVVSATSLVERGLAAISDGHGGAIVAFEAMWTDGPKKGDTDLFAQRIDRDSQGLWNEGAPVALASSDWTERSVSLVPDGEGGAIAVFEIVPPTSHLSTDVDLAAQHVAADGSLLWHDGGRSAVLSATTHAERAPTAVADGRGGLLRGPHPRGRPRRRHRARGPATGCRRHQALGPRRCPPLGSLVGSPRGPAARGEALVHLVFVARQGQQPH